MGKPKLRTRDEGHRQYSTKPVAEPDPEATEAHPSPCPIEVLHVQNAGEQQAHHPHHHHNHKHEHQHHHHQEHSTPSEMSRLHDKSHSSHHTSRSHVGRAQLDYVMQISQSKGHELLLKHKIQTIPTEQRSKSDYDADEESGVEESKSTVLEQSRRIRTIAHHTRLASLYGPISEYERPTVEGVRGSGPTETSSLVEEHSSRVLPISSKSKTKSVRFTKGLSGWCQRRCEHLSDISEDDQLDALGEWDYWKGYYCGKQSQNRKYKAESLSWAIMFVLGQCGFMELVHYVHKWGSAFMVVTIFFYLAVGYPMYILESGSGQYSGRKPLQMLRYLCPSLSGLGGVLYIRTVLLAIRAMGIFLYSTYFALHFLSCTINANQVLQMFNNQTLRHAPFPAGQFTITVPTSVPVILVLVSILFSICAIGFYTLNKFGRLFRITTQILTVIQIMYFFVIWTRYLDSKNVKRRNRTLLVWSRYGVSKPGRDANYDSAPIWQPALDFVEFRPEALLQGRLWIDAIVYVVTSLVLGTLVHPYLNSRSAFHYRSGRDGFLVVLYSLFMNYLSVGSVVLCMNYIVPNKRQIAGALQNLSGPYGILIVYAMQHHQAQYTGKMETDILFWAGVFYASIGLSSYLAVNGYIHVLVHCSYQERTSAGIKVIIYVLVVVVFALVLPVFLLCKEGVQHLIFLDFYANRCMVLIVFTCGAYFWAIAWGHGLHKFVYDFRNMMHFDIFGAEHISARYTKYARFVVSIALVVTLLHAALLDQVPVAGNTDYGSLPSHVATGVSWLLCGAVVLVATAIEGYFKGYTGRKKDNKRAWRPHRDWFKNPFHYKTCFIKAAEPEAGEGEAVVE